MQLNMDRRIPKAAASHAQAQQANPGCRSTAPKNSLTSS